MFPKRVAEDGGVITPCETAAGVVEYDQAKCPDIIKAYKLAAGVPVPVYTKTEAMLTANIKCHE